MRAAVVRSILVSLVVVAAGGIVGPAGAAVATAPAETAGSCPAVEIAVSADGLTAPASVGAGLRTFRVTTTDPAGAVLGLFRLDRGIVLDEFVALLRVALTGEGQERVAAGNAVAEQATLLGGMNTVPGRPGTFTQIVRPGTYHLIDYQDILSFQTPVAVRPLVVTDHWQLCPPPLPQATIEMLETPDGPRFRAPSNLELGAPVLVRNRTGHVEEAVFMAVRPGVTAEEVRQFFEALDNHQAPPSIPFTSDDRPRGMPVIHAPLAAVIEPNLAPGRYALLTWLIDGEARHRAADGMVAIVTVG
jgi:hypothetical protein